MNENTENQPENNNQPMEHKTIINPSDSFIQEVKSTQTNNPVNNDQGPNLNTNSNVNPSPADSTPTQTATTDSTYSQPSINQQPPNQAQVITDSSSSVDSMPQVISSGGSEFSSNNQSPNNNTHDVEYSSNPFVNLSQGLSRILSTNSVSALLGSIFIIVVPALIELVLYLLKVKSVSVILILLLPIIYLIFTVLITGLTASIAVASYKGERESFLTSLGNSFKKFFSLLLLQIILSVLTGIGLILFIIPGMIFISRSYLAYIVMFDENLGPIKSIKRSFTLTKNHTFEMFASLLTIIFFFGALLLSIPISSGQLLGRYTQLKQAEKNQTSTKTHWLNYALSLICLVVFGLFILLGFLIFDKAKNSLMFQGTSVTSNLNTSSLGQNVNNAGPLQQNQSNQKTIEQSNIAELNTLLSMYNATYGSYPANKLSLENWLNQPQQSSAHLAQQISNSLYYYQPSPKGCGDTISNSGNMSSTGLMCSSYVVEIVKN